eukprot:TRINITY_DN8852_c0_g1_i1.p1 TRINITY_DN8852_c0_g1~~TRINITY_DN8852_c0_g1_i1.p1  ORF type:complete len:424 (+),score=103.63 TRINITY_DN8852_c0_g1_i1:22-1272(+)
MNRQILSFTYNFDTSHLNNGNSENSSNDNGNNEKTLTVPPSPSLSNSNYFSYLQNNNNYTNNSSTSPLVTSTNNFQSNNNMNLSNSYSHLNLGQSQYLPPIQSPSNYMSSPMPFNNQMNSGGYLNAPLNVTNALPPIKNLNPLSQSRPKINPLNYVPSTPSYTSLSTPSFFSNPLNGLGHESLDLGGEENEEIKKMSLNQLGLSQFNQYIPTQENVQESSQDTNKDTNDDDFNYDQKEPVLQNVISTFSLDCKLDLPKIQKKARNTEYHPKRFAALVMRIKSPQTTALIFSSGKVVVTGAKNESESKLACKKFARIVKKLDFPATFKDFKVQNIVASCEVGYKVSLEALNTSEHINSCRFEPELFPGLIYKMIEPKVTLLIFVSGKIVITGAKTKKGVEAAFKNISPVLSNFKKPA